MNYLTALFLALGFSLNGFAQNSPFDSLKYTHVIVYEYLGGEGKGQPLIVENGKLPYTTKQVELSKNQVSSIVEILGSESTYGGDKAYCFIPRIGIVFYQKEEIVAHISICLQCNYLISSIDIPAKEVVKIIDGEYEYPAEGFSDVGKKLLMDFCFELGFDNCNK